MDRTARPTDRQTLYSKRDSPNVTDGSLDAVTMALYCAATVAICVSVVLCYRYMRTPRRGYFVGEIVVDHELRGRKYTTRKYAETVIVPQARILGRKVAYKAYRRTVTEGPYRYGIGSALDFIEIEPYSDEDSTAIAEKYFAEQKLTKQRQAEAEARRQEKLLEASRQLEEARKKAQQEGAEWERLKAERERERELQRQRRQEREEFERQREARRAEEQLRKRQPSTKESPKLAKGGHASPAPAAGSAAEASSLWSTIRRWWSARREPVSSAPPRSGPKLSDDRGRVADRPPDVRKAAQRSPAQERPSDDRSKARDPAPIEAVKLDDQFDRLIENLVASESAKAPQSAGGSSVAAPAVVAATPGPGASASVVSRPKKPDGRKPMREPSATVTVAEAPVAVGSFRTVKPPESGSATAIADEAGCGTQKARRTGKRVETTDDRQRLTPSAPSSAPLDFAVAAAPKTVAASAPIYVVSAGSSPAASQPSAAAASRAEFVRGPGAAADRGSKSNVPSPRPYDPLSNVRPANSNAKSVGDVKPSPNGSPVECVICTDARPEFAFVPCGHFCVCSRCVAMCKMVCPFCRVAAAQVLRIYQP